MTLQVTQETAMTTQWTIVTYTTPYNTHNCNTGIGKCTYLNTPPSIKYGPKMNHTQQHTWDTHCTNNNIHFFLLIMNKAVATFDAFWVCQAHIHTTLHTQQITLYTMEQSGTGVWSTGIQYSVQNLLSHIICTCTTTNRVEPQSMNSQPLA